MDNQVTDEKQFDIESKSDKIEELLERINLPSNLESKIDEIIKELESLKEEELKLFATSEDLLKWINALYNSANIATQGDVYNKKINSVNSDFVQDVPHGDTKLKASHMTFKTKQGSNYTGESQKLRFMQSLQLGTPFQVPLYHSGFWVSIKPPSDSILLELDRKIANEKTILSRTTYGIALSNNNVFLNNNILDTLLDHVFNQTLELKDNQDLRDYIKIQDMPILIWGLACAIWSKGFSYQRACTVDHTKCKHVLQALLSLRKLQFTDIKGLTSKQLEHMSKRTPNSVSVESLTSYQNDFNTKSKLIKLNDEVSIRLKVPTIREHIEAGYNWVTEIENNFADALLKSEKERENYLINQSKCTIARNYSHFIDALVRTTHDNDIEVVEETDNREFIDSMLNQFDIDLTNKFIDSCITFIEEVTISIIAIPNYSCPNCNEKQVINNEEGFKSDLIAIDPGVVFFILLSQKTKMIQTR